MSISLSDELLSDRSAGKRNYYIEFIEGSRWLRKEHAAARVIWFDNLILPDKENVLFEFEMLLKGLICFGNPVNHPGPPLRGEPAVARVFKDELGVAREIIRRIIAIGRKLSRDTGNSLIFQRYLESIIGQDEARFKMVKRSLDQDTPAQSLTLIIGAFSNLLEITEGLSRLPHVSFRLFSNIIHLAQREIHRSTFFDPLAALEFREEFDKVRPDKILQLIQNIESEPARRVMSLTFLSLFRLLKYLKCIHRAISQKVPPGVLFAWLAVLRSDIRALIIFFKREAARWLSSGFGKLYDRLTPETLSSMYGNLREEFQHLRSLKELLASTGDQLRLEQVKAYEQQIPAIGSIDDWQQFTEQTDSACNGLSAFVQNAAVLLAREFEPAMQGKRMFVQFVSARERSDRLRRDIWMFQKVLRAFIEKTKGSARVTDRWSGMSTFRFVREFVGYFRSMGYQLLRYSDYAEFDKFMQLVDRLREGDVLEVQRVSNVIAACEDFMSYLDRTFEAVSQREELKDCPFDRREAARTLKLFLKR